MTRPQDIKGKLTFRLGKGQDAERMLRKFGTGLFEDSGFSEFAVFDLDRAIERMSRQVGSGETPMVVAEVDGEPVGFAAYFLDHTFTVDPVAHLWVIYCCPQYRRSPIGRMLMTYMFTLARGEGATAMLVTVPMNAPSARGLCNLLKHEGCEPMRGAFVKRLR